jgi:hypothetical protein
MANCLSIRVGGEVGARRGAGVEGKLTASGRLQADRFDIDSSGGGGAGVVTGRVAWTTISSIESMRPWERGLAQSREPVNSLVRPHSRSHALTLPITGLSQVTGNIPRLPCDTWAGPDPAMQ